MRLRRLSISKELGVVGTGGLVGIGREDFDDSSEWWVSGASSTEEDGWTVEQGTGGGAREDKEAEIGGVASEAVSSGGLDVGTGDSRAWGSVSTVMGREGRTAGMAEVTESLDRVSTIAHFVWHFCLNTYN